MGSLVIGGGMDGAPRHSFSEVFSFAQRVRSAEIRCRAAEAGAAIQLRANMSLEIQCPTCGQVGNVPDEAIGQRVKCHACGSIMIIAEPPATSPEELVFNDPYAAPRPWVPVQSAVDPQSLRWKVQSPAIALIVTSVIGIGLSITMIQNYFQMQSMQPMYHDMGEFLGQQPGPNDEHAQQVRETMSLFSSMLSSTGSMRLITGLLGVASSGVVFAGALSMMSLRWYPLAIAGSVLAIIPMVSPCCLLGLPFGIWSLVVLLQPDVRAAFS